MITWESFSDYLKIGKDYCILANLYNQLGKKSQAEKCYKKANKIAEYLGRKLNE